MTHYPAPPPWSSILQGARHLTQTSLLAKELDSTFSVELTKSAMWAAS